MYFGVLFSESFSKIKRMGKEVDKFVEGHHQKDIAHVTA